MEKIVNKDDLSLILYVLEYVYDEKLLGDETLEEVKQILDKYNWG